MNSLNSASADDFNPETLADKIVEKINVAPGQVIWIWSSTHSLYLIEALALRIRMRGAFWMLRLIMEPLLKKIGQQAPEQYLGLVPEHELRLLDDISTIVEIHDHGGYIPDVELKRRRMMAAEWIALIDTASRKGVRSLIATNPTPALAEAYGIQVETLRRAYGSAMNVDLAALDQLQKKTADRLRGSQQIRIQSPAGTDLELSIAGREILLDTNSLPYGEVYTAPIEDSAEGVVVVDKTFLQGRPVEDLRVTFRKGRVAAIEAPRHEDAEAFQALLDASSGDKDVIAEFAIGLNPGIHEPIGDAAIDEKIGGSAHIAVGMNDRFGGRNHSNLHKDLVILNARIWVDGIEYSNDKRGRSK